MKRIHLLLILMPLLGSCSTEKAEDTSNCFSGAEIMELLVSDVDREEDVLLKCLTLFDTKRNQNGTFTQEVRNYSKNYGLIKNTSITHFINIDIANLYKDKDYGKVLAISTTDSKLYLEYKKKLKSEIALNDWKDGQNRFHYKGLEYILETSTNRKTERGHVIYGVRIVPDEVYRVLTQ
jgi:hypothetical protein